MMVTGTVTATAVTATAVTATVIVDVVMVMMVACPTRLKSRRRVQHTHQHDVKPAATMQKVNEKFQTIRADVENRVDRMKKVPSEMMASGVWSSCADNVAKQFAIGATTGLALSLVLFRTCPAPVWFPMPIARLLTFWPRWHRITHGSLAVPLRRPLQVAPPFVASLSALAAAWAPASPLSAAMLVSRRCKRAGSPAWRTPSSKRSNERQAC